MTHRHGTARIRGLAAELKALRLAAGLNTRDAAKMVGISSSSLNRMELGKREITPEDMAGLLVAYRVFGKERERLMDLAREAKLHGWWETSHGVISRHLRTLITFEAEATQIVAVAMMRIPGLMQTRAFIRAFMTACDVPPGLLETKLEIRVDRQKILDKPRPPKYLVIIGEEALHRPLGGPNVMAEQIRHILRLAGRPNIDVRVIPFSHGGHVGLNGGYVMLEFPKARTIVYLEGTKSSAYVDDPDDVAPFHRTTDTLMRTALGPLESVEFLARKAANFDRN